MSGVHFAKFVVERPWLQKLVQPLSNWYVNASGYRQLGLRMDDLLEEDNPVVQTALRRLDDRTSYDRVFRLRRAVQCSFQHKLLPKSEWTKPEEDIRYLTPIVDAIKAEQAEAKALDTVEVIKSH